MLIIQDIIYLFVLYEKSHSSACYSISFFECMYYAMVSQEWWSIKKYRKNSDK